MSAHHHVYFDENENAKSLFLDEVPSGCPRCQKAIPLKPVATKEIYSPEADAAFAQIVYLCPLCERYFIAEYYQDDLAAAHLHGEEPCMELERLVPEVFKAKRYSKTILDASPDFVRLVAQAEAAEFYELNDIAGPACRKALEFLVKDYAISKHPTAKETIKSKALADVIGTYITDPRIKEMAKRAAWLGNDETHYVRAQPNFNLEDMKYLIGLTIHWIEMEQMTEEYNQKIQSANRGPRTP